MPAAVSLLPARAAALHSARRRSSSRHSQPVGTPEAHSSNSSWLRLNGKVAVVTGGASGLGRAISLELALQGVRVAVLDVQPEDQGLQVVNMVTSSTGQHAMYAQVDIAARENTLPETIGRVASTLGRIDVLVNNAGINVPALLVDEGGKHEVSDSVLDRVLAVNVKGVFRVTQAVVRHMLECGTTGGVVINIASEAGSQGSAGQSVYAASKGAVYAMTHSWAKEFKGSIRVMGVSPGVLEATGLRTPAYEEALAYTRGQTVQQLRESYAKGILLGREARLGEVASVVAFLASHRASYIDGTVLNVTGGKSWL